MTSVVRVLLGVALFLGPTVAAAEVAPLPFRQWTEERPGPTFTVERDVLRVKGGGGWVRTIRSYVDFVVRLQFRSISPDAEGALVVRGWVGRPGRSPATGYRISLGGNDGAVKGYSQRVNPESGARSGALDATRSQGEWRTLEVRCYGDRVTVLVDGLIRNDVTGSEPLAGKIGIEGKKGVMEYRAPTVEPLAFEESDTTTPVRPVEAGKPRPDVTLPRVRAEVRPRYTADALVRQVEGTAWVEALVLRTGVVGSAILVKSFDPDLDAEALAAARRWRFYPGTRNDQPVPVLVTIELTFTLR